MNLDDTKYSLAWGLVFLSLMVQIKPLRAQTEAISEVYNFNLEVAISDIYLPEISSETKHYALLIGVNQYEDSRVEDLAHPLEDALGLQEVLEDFYGYEKENTTLLSNPTEAEIIKALGKMKAKVGPNDDLLIFYAGHGDWDGSVGYWWPSDADKDNVASWLSNTELRDYINQIKSKHTLVIADACFSGSLVLRKVIGDYTYKMYEVPSRKAITSGALKGVPDRSLFSEKLIKYLKGNKAQELPALELYQYVQREVVNNAEIDQIPQYGIIPGVGDDGGQFVFFRKY